jgi:short-subunit dehydrogenase
MGIASMNPAGTASMNAGRTALITGASSGIGEAFAEVFAAHGFNLVITARREDRLRAVAERLEQHHGIHVLVVVADHSRPDAAERLCAEIASRGLTIDALVNNAGYGVPGTFIASDWQRHQDMLQVMVVGLAELTHRLLPGMVERGYGRIVNVASLAGLVPAPAGHTLYAAAKALVIKFSEALSNEVRRHNIHVTAICPGFTLSEFHDVTGTREQMKNMPAWMWLDALTVARQGYDAVMGDTPIYINGRVYRTIALFVRLFPQGIVKAVGRRLGRSYRKT